MAMRPCPVWPLLQAAAAWLPLLALAGEPGPIPGPIPEQSVEVELSVQGMT